MIICVAHEIPQDAYDRAAAVVEHYAMYEAGFAGASIERCPFTCGADSESADANVLLNAVRHAIDGEDVPPAADIDARNGDALGEPS